MTTLIVVKDLLTQKNEQSSSQNDWFKVRRDIRNEQEINEVVKFVNYDFPCVVWRRCY